MGFTYEESALDEETKMLFELHIDMAEEECDCWSCIYRNECSEDNKKINDEFYCDVWAKDINAIWKDFVYDMLDYTYAMEMIEAETDS